MQWYHKLTFSYKIRNSKNRNESHVSENDSVEGCLETSAYSTTSRRLLRTPSVTDAILNSRPCFSSLLPWLPYDLLLISFPLLFFPSYCFVSRGKSVSIVSDYELDDRGSIPDRGRGFSLCVQTGSGAHPASYPMGTGVPFPRGKAQPERDC
jgi:hypothetical protein